MPSQNHYDVLIVGGGVCGAALCYTVAEYTNLSRIALLEKYESLAKLNSNGLANSQTLHCGDIETNYTLDKAQVVKTTSNMVREYCRLKGHLEAVDNLGAAERQIMYKIRKMVMAVGETEIAYLKERYQEFLPLYPYLRQLDQEHLEDIEPNLVFLKNGERRTEPVYATGTDTEYSAVNYGELTRSFVEQASLVEAKTINLFLNTRTLKIQKSGDHFLVKTSNVETPELTADFIVVDAGAHSLLLAHEMGYGLDLSVLPVAGSFYYASSKLLTSKVYMVQNPKLPFAALHCDPDIVVVDKLRIGPTALVLPKLERYQPGTYLDFWRSLQLDGAVISALWKLFGDQDIRDYIIRNMLFEIPGLGDRLFLNDAQKIIPSLTLEDITYAKHIGGVRPQVMNKITKQLQLGEAKIETGEGILFNMTPSPGASSCLGNARTDVRILSQYLGCSYDEERLVADLVR
jgi:malate dehydrogenase (quinone)